MTVNDPNADATTTADDTELTADESLIEPLREKLLDEFGTQLVDKKEVGDDDLKRYLLARQNNIDKTYEMAKDAIQWRLEKKPEAIRVSDFSTANEQGVHRFAGYAKNGWPIILITGRLWDPSEYSMEEYVNMIAFLMETNIKRMDPSIPDSNKKHFVLMDVKGMSYLKSDLKKIRQFVKIVADYYPERLGLSVVVNADAVTDYLWKFCKMFMDQRTINKVQIFRADGYLDFLDEHIGLENVTTDLGGKRTEEWPLLSDEDTQDDYMWAG